MSIFARRPRLRWLVPVLAAVVLAGGGSAVGVITAAARSGLPHRSAAQLLVDVQNARLDGLSGTVVQNADLGLPSLPGVGGNGSSDLTSLVAGSHTLRLWYAGPQHVRLSLLGSLGESDVVRNGTDVWQWSSATKSAVHRTVPAGLGGEGHSLASVSPVTPQQAADAALKAITPSTRVSTEGTAVVAGRSAYELVLRPRDASSLVGSVRIAVDGRTHVPMRVQVFPRHDGKPAFEVGFTSFDPTAPDSSVFRFNPPPGTKVTRAPALSGLPAPRGTRDRAPAAPVVRGSGWASVVVARLPQDAASGPASVSGMLRVLPRVHGSWGSGHLLRGRLFSAVATDDGRVAVGAVAPQVLYRYLQRR
jgi:outer membrane lipoprotein-sorting protein